MKRQALGALAVVLVITAATLGCATGDPAVATTAESLRDDSGATRKHGEAETGVGGLPLAGDAEIEAIVNAVPGLAVSEWYQPPVSTPRDDDHIYIVEFWATWCSPCLATIPELNALHRLYPDLITLIAVTDEDRSRVVPFIEERGTGMQFAVARDTGAKDSWAAFMTANNEGGIPHAFVVSGGETKWHGHSANLPRILRTHLDPTEMDRRMADRPTGTITGTLTHAGTPLAELGVQSLDASLLDTLNRGAGWQPVSYAAAESRFTGDEMPVSSYYVQVDGHDSHGRRYYASETVFGEPGRELTVPVMEVVKVEPPSGSSREGEALEIPDTTPALRWKETRETTRYHVRFYRTEGNSHTRLYDDWVPGAALELAGDAAVEPGATYLLYVTGYAADGGYISQLYTDHPSGYVRGGMVVAVR
ncbi:MAG: TlpA family protein disulfide reductase [Spirochaetota bacterium]